jgi:haloacid dehalogenase-like hydrolase
VLLAVDLDGTLLDTSGRPHDRDVRAIRAAMTAGIRVTIVTGRLYSGTRAFVELLGLRWAVACADGSHLVHAVDHATLMHIGVRGAEAALLRRAFSDAGVPTFVFARDAIGHDLSGAPFVDYVATWSDDIRVAASVFEHEFWDAEEGVTAVVAVGTREQIASVVDALARDLPRAVLVAAFPMRRGRHIGHDRARRRRHKGHGGSLDRRARGNRPRQHRLRRRLDQRRAHVRGGRAVLRDGPGARRGEGEGDRPPGGERRTGWRGGRGCRESLRNPWILTTRPTM